MMRSACPNSPRWKWRKPSICSAPTWRGFIRSTSLYRRAASAKLPAWCSRQAFCKIRSFMVKAIEAQLAVACDSKARGWLSHLMPRPHGFERAFKVTGKSRRIEQGRSVAVAQQLRPYLGERLRIARQRQGLRFVRGSSRRNQARQAHGVQGACGGPSGEAIAQLGQQGNAGPQRIAGGGVSIVGERVQEQIGQ